MMLPGFKGPHQSPCRPPLQASRRKANEHVFYTLGEQSRKSLDHVVFKRDFHQNLYILSPIECVFYGNYVLCDARQGWGRGKWLWSDRSPWNRRGVQEEEEDGQKIEKRRIVLHVCTYMSMHTHTHGDVYMQKGSSWGAACNNTLVGMCHCTLILPSRLRWGTQSL